MRALGPQNRDTDVSPGSERRADRRATHTKPAVPSRGVTATKTPSAASRAPPNISHMAEPVPKIVAQSEEARAASEPTIPTMTITVSKLTLAALAPPMSGARHGASTDGSPSAASVGEDAVAGRKSSRICMTSSMLAHPRGRSWLPRRAPR